MHFYEVRGLLVRRWVPTGRRLAMEVWTGDGWAPFLDVDHVLRFGVRVSDSDALALLHEIRRRDSTLSPLAQDEAETALRSRLRRSKTMLWSSEHHRLVRS